MLGVRSDIPHLCRRRPLFLNRSVQVGTTEVLKAFRMEADMHTALSL